MLSTKPNSAALILLLDLVYLAIIFYLANRSFQVNLSKHFEQKRHIVVAAVIMQPVIAMLLLVGQLVYHVPLLITDNHPDKYDYSTGDYDNYYSALWHWDEQSLIEKVVDEAVFPDKAILLNQIDYAEHYRVQMKLLPDQVKGQLPHQDQGRGLFDNTNNVYWQYSHKQSLYVGRDKYSNDLAGYLGKQGFYATLANDTNVQYNVFEAVAGP